MGNQIAAIETMSDAQKQLNEWMLEFSKSAQYAKMKAQFHKHARQQSAAKHKSYAAAIAKAVQS